MADGRPSSGSSLTPAFTMGAAAVITDVTAWTDVALMLTFALVALVSGVGVFVLTPATSPVARRLAGTLGLGAVTATGVRYWRHRHVLTHLAFGASSAALSVTTGWLVAGQDATTTTADAWAGSVLLVACIGWVVAAESGRFTPAWLGTLAAGATSYAAVGLAASPWELLVGSNRVGILLALTLTLAVSYTFAGAVTSRIRPTIVGMAGLVVTVPWAMTEILGWSPTSTAAVLLPVGLALTLWAVVVGMRRTGPNDMQPR